MFLWLTWDLERETQHVGFSCRLVRIPQCVLYPDWYRMACTRHVYSGWELLRTTGRIPLLVPASGVGCWDPSYKDKGFWRLYWKVIVPVWGVDGVSRLWLIGFLVCYAYMSLLFMPVNMAWVLEKWVWICLLRKRVDKIHQILGERSYRFSIKTFN